MDRLLSLSLLGDSRITFYQNGSEVAQTQGVNLTLDLLGLINNERQYWVSAPVTVPFDSVRLDHRHVVGALANMNVHAVRYAE